MRFVTSMTKVRLTGQNCLDIYEKNWETRRGGFRRMAEQVLNWDEYNLEQAKYKLWRSPILSEGHAWEY